MSIACLPSEYPIEREQFRVLGEIAYRARAEDLREEVRACLSKLLATTHLKLVDVAELLGVNCISGPKEGRSLSIDRIVTTLLPGIRKSHELEIPEVPKFVRRQMHSQQFAINEGRETSDELVPRTQLLFQLLRQLHISIEGTTIHEDASEDTKGHYRLITVPKTGRSFYVSDAPDLPLYVLQQVKHPERLSRLAPKHLECLEKLGMVQRMEEKGVVSWKLKLVPLVLADSQVSSYPLGHRLSRIEHQTESRMLGIQRAQHYGQVCKKRKKTKTNHPRLFDNPDREYAGEGWEDWYECLGTERPVPTVSYTVFVSTLSEEGITTEDDFRDAKKAGRLPGLPWNPQREYGKEWHGWNVAFGKRISFTQQRKEMSVLQVTTWKQFEVALRDNPHWVADPNKHFKIQGGFLALVGKTPHVELFTDFIEALSASSIRSQPDYRDTKVLPPGFPRRPDVKYKDKGWVSWPDTFERCAILDTQAQETPASQLETA